MYDYVGGKVDWRASDLPTDGEPRARRLGDLARRDPPTCDPDEPVAVVAERAGGGCCVVVNPAGVVLGLVEAESDSSGGRDGERRVEDVMAEGPSTFRPDVPAGEMTDHLEGRKPVLVTTSEGRLVGLVDPDEVRAAAHEAGGSEVDDGGGEGEAGGEGEGENEGGR